MMKLKKKENPIKPRVKLVKVKPTEETYNDAYLGNFLYKPVMTRKVIVDTLPKLKRLAKEMSTIPAFAFDTEDNTLRVVGENEDFSMVGISISWGAENNYYIPFGHRREEDADSQLPLDVVCEYMKPIFEREDVLILAWGLKYDSHALRRLKIKIKTLKLFDGMLASWLCDENTPNGLKENSQEKLHLEQSHFKDCTDTVPTEVRKSFGYKANSRIPIDLVLIKDCAPYALDDSFNTWCLCQGFMQELIDLGMDKIYYKMSIPFLLTLIEMEEHGVCVDVEKLTKMGVDMQEDLDRLQYQIYELSGVEFNIGSSQQKAEILFGWEKPPSAKGKITCNEHLLAYNFGFKSLGKTKKGAPSTDSDTIWKLSQKAYPRDKRKQQGVEMCALMLDYSTLSKLKSAFVDGILKQLYSDGKAHPNFNQIGTDSGRLSCIAENSKVRCVNEDKNIQDVKVGDIALCFDDLGNLHFRKVLKVIDNGILPCVSVEWRGVNFTKGKFEDVTGNLVCTPDHRIWGVDGKWIQAKDLDPGDQIEYGDKWVRRVVECGKHHVYDLEIEEYHNFIAEQVCVHNCSEPNLQQLPKADDEDKYMIRSVFIGSEYYKTRSGNIYDTYEEMCENETTGSMRNHIVKRKKILALDYKNLEMMCLAHFSKDKNLLEMFANNDDAHGSTAVNMFGLPCTASNCKKEFPHLRQAAKTINFMLMYGGGASALYLKLKEDRNAPVDLGSKEYLDEYKEEGAKTGEDVAQIYIDKYFKSYEGVAKFISNQKKFAHRNGFVYTIRGRKRRLVDINSSNYGLRAYSERLSVNSAIQGTAGDITISAQNRIFLDQRLLELKCYMLIQIHDELVFECPEEYLEECTPIIKHYMENPFGDDVKLNLDLVADFDSGDNYQQAK